MIEVGLILGVTYEGIETVQGARCKKYAVACSWVRFGWSADSQCKRKTSSRGLTFLCRCSDLMVTYARPLRHIESHMFSTITFKGYSMEK